MKTHDLTPLKSTTLWTSVMLNSLLQMWGKLRKRYLTQSQLVTMVQHSQCTHKSSRSWEMCIFKPFFPGYNKGSIIQEGLDSLALIVNSRFCFLQWFMELWFITAYKYVMPSCQYSWESRKLVYKGSVLREAQKNLSTEFQGLPSSRQSWMPISRLNQLEHAFIPSSIKILNSDKKYHRIDFYWGLIYYEWNIYHLCWSHRVLFFVTMVDCQCFKASLFMSVCMIHVLCMHVECDDSTVSVFCYAAARSTIQISRITVNYQTGRCVCQISLKSIIKTFLRKLKIVLTCWLSSQSSLSFSSFLLMSCIQTMHICLVARSM